VVDVALNADGRTSRRRRTIPGRLRQPRQRRNPRLEPSPERRLPDRGRRPWPRRSSPRTAALCARTRADARRELTFAFHRGSRPRGRELEPVDSIHPRRSRLPRAARHGQRRRRSLEEQHCRTKCPTSVLVSDQTRRSTSIQRRRHRAAGRGRSYPSASKATTSSRFGHRCGPNRVQGRIPASSTNRGRGLPQDVR